MSEAEARVGAAPSATENKVDHHGGHEQPVRAESRLPGGGRVAFRRPGRTHVAE